MLLLSLWHEIADLRDRIRLMEDQMRIMEILREAPLARGPGGVSFVQTREEEERRTVEKMRAAASQPGVVKTGDNTYYYLIPLRGGSVLLELPTVDDHLRSSAREFPARTSTVFLTHGEIVGYGTEQLWRTILELLAMTRR